MPARLFSPPAMTLYWLYISLPRPPPMKLLSTTLSVGVVPPILFCCPPTMAEWLVLRIPAPMSLPSPPPTKSKSPRAMLLWPPPTNE
jgi:hypothetical protein